MVRSSSAYPSLFYPKQFVDARLFIEGTYPSSITLRYSYDPSDTSMDALAQLAITSFSRDTVDESENPEQELKRYSFENIDNLYYLARRDNGNSKFSGDSDVAIMFNRDYINYGEGTGYIINSRDSIKAVARAINSIIYARHSAGHFLRINGGAASLFYSYEIRETEDDFLYYYYILSAIIGDYGTAPYIEGVAITKKHISVNKETGRLTNHIHSDEITHLDIIPN
jgi:hypothetical protein